MVKNLELFLDKILPKTVSEPLQVLQTQLTFQGRVILRAVMGHQNHTEWWLLPCYASLFSLGSSTNHHSWSSPLWVLALENPTEETDSTLHCWETWQNQQIKLKVTLRRRLAAVGKAQVGPEPIAGSILLFLSFLFSLLSIPSLSPLPWFFLSHSSPLLSLTLAHMDTVLSSLWCKRF